jgi:hypothetical protein
MRVWRFDLAIGRLAPLAADVGNPNRETRPDPIRADFAGTSKGDEAMTEARSESASAVNRPGLLTAMKVVAALYVALVLVQAIIAGRGWFKPDLDLIETHGQIGSGVMLVAIVQGVLAFMVFGARSWLALASAALVVLTAIQMALGYSSTDGSGNATSASLHIPNGVLIFGIATALTSSVLRVRRSV